LLLLLSGIRVAAKLKQPLLTRGTDLITLQEIRFVTWLTPN